MPALNLALSSQALAVASKIRSASKERRLQRRGQVAAANIELHMIEFRNLIIGLVMGVAKHPKGPDYFITLRSRYLQFWGGYLLRHMVSATPAKAAIETFPQSPANA
jgi:hypothetical protein